MSDLEDAISGAKDAADAYAVSAREETKHRHHILDYERAWPDDPRLKESHARHDAKKAELERHLRLVAAIARAEAYREAHLDLRARDAEAEVERLKEGE